MTLAETILAFEDRPRTKVAAWGQTLYLVPMSGADRDRFDREQYTAAKAQDGSHLINWRARYVVRCMVDESGARIFTDAQAEALAGKNGETIKRLFEQAESISETGQSAVDNAAKNS